MKFRMTAATGDSISRSARHLRRALRDQGVKVSQETLTTGLNHLITGIGKNNGQAPAAAPAPTENVAAAVYNRAGDTLALAFQHFTAGDIENGLQMVALAFSDESCRPLMDAIVQCNDEAKPENDVGDEDADLTTANADDNNDDDNDNDDADADDAVARVTAGEKKYRNRLNKSIRRVTAAIVANDESVVSDDDDNNDNDDDDDNNDDDLVAQQDEGAADDNNDDNDDNNDDDDNDDNNNDDEEDAALVGDNMPPITAKILKRLDDPSLVAAANKISLGGSKQSRRRAGQFIRRVGNLHTR